MTALMRWFRSPKVGVVSFRVRKQMSYSASLSRICGRLCLSGLRSCIIVQLAAVWVQCGSKFDTGASLQRG